MAALVDYFLKVDGVEGESTDDKHKAEIELESFSFGGTNAGSFSSGAGGGTGKVALQDFHFVKKCDKASPKLFVACATGEHIKMATLTCRKAGKDQQEFLVIKMNDVLVTSVADSDDSGGAQLESVTLAFAKVDLEYRPQKADGSLDAGLHFKYDLKASKEG